MLAITPHDWTPPKAGAHTHTQTHTSHERTHNYYNSEFRTFL